MAMDSQQAPLLQVRDLVIEYQAGEDVVHAVDHLSLELAVGDSLGLVGESGSGKSSLAVALLRMLPENARVAGGRVVFDGADVVEMSKDELRRFRWQRMAVVFQAAMSSFNPVRRIGDQLVEAYQAHQDAPASQIRTLAVEEFGRLDLAPELLDHYPHELSGGMRQRAAIAMALLLRPDILVADEPTAALDPIVQQQVLMALERARDEHGMALLLISHDLSLATQACQRVAVMYAGKIVELASAEALVTAPLHPYSRALAASAPRLHGPKSDLAELPGEPPSLVSPPAGCRFHPRCPLATEVCRESEPELVEHQADRWVACWHPLERKEGKGG